MPVQDVSILGVKSGKQVGVGKIKKMCPGIDKGKLHKLEDIQSNLKIYDGRFG